jgi:glycosyltransferase involved in cell wall biosynthesis
MSLFLECTPAIVNKTAVYQLIIDTVEKMLSEQQNFQVLILDSIFTLEPSQNVLAFFKEKETILRSRYNQFIQNYYRYFWRYIFFQKEKTILFFDPLYTLLYKKINNSTVIVHDLTCVTHPEWHEGKVSLLYQFALDKIRNSECKIVAVSQNTSDSLEVNYSISPDRMKCEYLNSNLSTITPRKKTKTSVVLNHTGQEPGNYFLFVGSLEKRKNVLGLIKAFALSGLSEKGFSLVIAGGKSLPDKELSEWFTMTEGVELVGYVSTEKLEELYTNAFCFVYPSFLEGYGVPLLEALVRKIPCISTLTGASPEIGKNNVIYIDPESIEDISGAMVQVSNGNFTVKMEPSPLGLENTLTSPE